MSKESTKYGPKMAALPNEKWREFVRLYVMRGCAPGAGPALVAAAGFRAGSRDSAKVQSYRMLQDERVQAAIVEQTRRYLVGVAPRAVRAIEMVLDEEGSSASERTSAAKALLDRAGLHMVQEQVQVLEMRADPEQVGRVAALIAMLGLPPEVAVQMQGKLLGGRVPAMIDVTPDPAPDGDDAED